MNTKREVLAVLPGDGWSATYVQDDGSATYDRVICWVVLKAANGHVEAVGMIPSNETKPYKPEAASRWTNFAGYVHA